MALSVNDREVVEAFRSFIEDSVGSDERYGSGSRHDRPDAGVTATRFHAGGACWFEVAVRAAQSEVRIGFITDDPITNDGMMELIADAGQTLSEFVAAGLTDAGLDWPDPPVLHTDENGMFSFTTPVKLEELGDLESEEIRDRVLRVLEGYLISFGPALLVEADTGDPDDDDLMDDE